MLFSKNETYTTYLKILHIMMSPKTFPVEIYGKVGVVVNEASRGISGSNRPIFERSM